MTKRIIKIDIGRDSSSYRIAIGGKLDQVGQWAEKSLKGGGRKIAIVSNPTVFNLYGETCERSLREDGFYVTKFLIRDGERHKTLKSAEMALEKLSEAGFSRSDAVIALGGGVVGDLAGFASSVYLRGISFLQIPTTLLSMVDSSVGGKTAVNTAFGKNIVGAFHQPKGVFIDTRVLGTLPQRERTAGFCEMVKHGALSGRKLLKETHDFLRATDYRQKADITELIAKNVEFKTRVVTSDERESPAKIDSRSRKILNFGHTLAHALEKATNYSYFRHGEAVGYGILYAAEISKSLDLLSKKDVKLLNDVVQCVGPLPSLANIDENGVIEAFGFDKKNIAGSLQMVLLKGIGKPVITMENKIPRPLMKKTLRQLLKRMA